MSNQQHPITPPPPHLLKKFSAQAQDETKKRNGAGYLKTFATLCIEWFVNSQLTSNDRQIRSSEIQPPPELVQKWLGEYFGTTVSGEISDVEHVLATRAAQWGADQELEACCDHMRDHQWGFVERPDGTKIHRAVYLQQSRRPKPPSLKEQALAELEILSDYAHGLGCSESAIRRALEALSE